MSTCTHDAEPQKIFDELGLMRDRGDGKVEAPVLAWRFICPLCGVTLSTHRADDPDAGWSSPSGRDTIQLDLFKIAGEKVRRAIHITRSYIKESTDDDPEPHR